MEQVRATTVAEPATEPVHAAAASSPVGAVVRSSPRTSRLAFLLDSTLAFTLAAVMVALRRLPVEAAFAAAAIWPTVMFFSGLYRRRVLSESRLGRLGMVWAIGLRAAVVTLAASPWVTDRATLALAELIGLFSIASGAHQLVGVRRHRLRLVLAGRPRDVRAAMVELRDASNHEVVAACLTRASRVPLGLPTYVGFATSTDVAQRHQADALVVLPGARLTPGELRRLHWALAGAGTDLCVGTGLLDVRPDRTRVFASGGLNLVHVAPASLHGPRRVVKDVLERSLAVFGLVLALPLLVLVGLAIRVDTPGPAIYRQQRVGKNGRLFTMYKLRSMSCSAESERLALSDANDADGVLFKIHRDPRVTKLGGWLRRWSIDEVPQLWNVVRGDMSLVGPRPALPEEVARYDVDPSRRLVVKPGLTGLWQVSGRSDLTWAEAVRLDVTYVDNWSLRLDISVLVRTISAVLRRRGAY